MLGQQISSTRLLPAEIVREDSLADRVGSRL